MKIYVKCLLFPYFLFLSGFHTWFDQIRWFYSYRSFKHSKWWRHNL